MTSINPTSFRRNFVLALVALSFALSACTTTRRKAFESVKVGMDKSTVIETAGGPNISERWHGKDRWIYLYRDGSYENHDIREVHFEEGRAVYVGGRFVPKVSAAEQDKLNEESNTAELRRWREEADRRHQLLGVSGSSSDGQENGVDRRFRESTYGVPSSPDVEAAKRPMTFEPVQ